MSRFAPMAAIGVCAMLALTPAASARPAYGLPSSCYIDPYRLTTYMPPDGWYHVAGDAAQKCYSGVAQQGLFVQLWEYWTSKDSSGKTIGWVKEGEGDTSWGGANQTIFAGDTVGCSSSQTRDWSMHARGFYEDNSGFIWAHTSYRTDELACRN